VESSLLDTAWSFFNMRFYVIGLIFIIFDVESALMFPVAVIFKKMNEIGRGGLVLVEIMIFLAVLISGIAYCWRKGDLGLG
jgi:NADH-quinone oxidoreductase subunit A